MKIGIIGSTDRAKAIGRLLADGNHELTMSDPCHPDQAEQAASQIGAATEIPYHQAMTRDVVFFATMDRTETDKALAAMGSHPKAAVVDARDANPTGGDPLSAEMLARKLDSHRVVRALVLLAKPGATVPLCGDDATTKELVDQAFAESGCITTDRGPLANASEIEPPAAGAA